MKRFKMKAYLLLTLILGVFILPGCGDGGNGHWDKPADSIGLVSIVVSPATATIPMDFSLPFTATATYEDGSSLDVTAASVWTSGNPAVATISPTTGVAQSISAGAGVVITATFGGMTAPTSLLTVTNATLTSITVTPDLATIALSGSRQLTATANYNDMSTYNVTAAPGTVWTAANSPIGGAAVATLSENGVRGAGRATGVLAGTAEITAIYLTQTDTAILEVSDLVLIITPGDVCSFDSGPTIPTATLSNPTSGNQFVTTSTSGVVNNGKSITATFNLEMDPTTINSSLPGALTTFTVMETATATNLRGTVTMDNTNKIATFTSSAALLPNANYTASITTDAMSAGSPGTAIACPYQWNFKTAASAAAGIAPVNLGRAATFVIASTAGVDNVGATTVNGDVVLDPNAVCNGVTVGSAGLIGDCNGIVPVINGTVISPLYPDAGVTSGQIIADMRAAYISLSPAQMSIGVTTIPDGTVMGAGEGTALVLNDNLFFPGIYKTTAGGMLITGDLTLDAQGNPDAVFVFQSDSSITTAATGPADPHTRILLVNGAKASNVFWWVGTNQATMGTYTIFRGNILSYSSITMETGASSCGRLFAGASTDGAFTFGENIVSVPGHPSAPAGCE
ncbi:MAG: hypothetical protein CVU69_07810 [Deltaproteobacteria bacterium HGW-Deltaproteobacteria-4]|nr:MAG: hypothetical protein CVU69_07810 [Deltaproteobacteria bacterium HGW-Deltaproteobacteria-4]